MIPIYSVYLNSNDLVEGRISNMLLSVEKAKATQFHIYIECYDSLLRVSRNAQYVFSLDETIAYIKAFGMSVDELR